MTVANSLLDFVMSLVRDPDAAARYAADPSQALADAHLTGVTGADVQNLIPVVSESLSMSVPSLGFDTFDAVAAEPMGNVWASGAATAAFDAFDDQVPTPVIVDPGQSMPVIVDEIDTGFDVVASADLTDPEVSLQVEQPVIDGDFPAGPGVVDDWAQPVASPEPDDRAPGFDLFD